MPEHEDLILLREEFPINCIYCDTALARLIFTTNKEDTKSVKTKFKVINCYKCGKDNPSTKIFEGIGYIVPPNDKVALHNVDTTIEEDIICCIFKAFKKENKDGS